MDELNWDYDYDDEEEFEGPADLDAFYQSLKIALQIQASRPGEAWYRNVRIREITR